MTNEKVIFVDMDGVVADFAKGVCDLYSIPKAILESMGGDYDIVKLVGSRLPANKFWESLDTHESFWENLPLTKEGKAIINAAEDLVGPRCVYFLSSPAISHNCYSGKAKWVQKHYPSYINRLILTKHKHFLAAPGRLLIDDADFNIENFEDCSGEGLLLPRYWNKLHEKADNSLAYFLDTLHTKLK